MVTFAVICHNEAPLLANVLRQAIEAAGPGDRVWLVDSQSTDDSAEIARSFGIEVLAGPLGKGRLLAFVLDRCRHGQVCLLDADIEASSLNIPQALGDAMRSAEADMVVGDFDWPQLRFTGALDGIYRPLVGDLFPEALGIAPRMPFSGFRALDAGLDLGTLPPRWGAETHLNLQVAATGRVTTVDLGVYEGPNRPKTRELAIDAAASILDLAERHGRLEPAMRPRWEAWVQRAMGVLGTQPGPDERPGDYPERLAEVPTWPRPATSALTSIA
ncbi:MAG: glucosyl-3-phosphoglycerate synthase [Thermoleophilaceae bacterium]|nr:glucosyl-3-phosphoglycerate synthase [Thermoleophilaceae bacterium]